MDDEVSEQTRRVDEIIDSYGGGREWLIMVLQDAQKEFNWLPEPVLHRIATRLGVPWAEVYGAASFYKAFSLEPRGRHILQVCMGTACHVRGAQRILDELERRLDIPAGSTTKDGLFTLETVNCLGACALGPIVAVDGEFHGSMTAARVPRLIEQYAKARRRRRSGAPTARFGVRLASVADLERFRAEAIAARPPKNREIILSADSTCCILRGSLGVAEALKKEIAARDLGEAVGLRLAGCLGFCEIEPMVVILPQRILYQRVKPEDVAEIIERTIQRGEVIERLLYTDPATKQAIAAIDKVPFYQKQMRLVLGPNESIEPTRFEDYVAEGGYSALAKVLSSMTPAAVIEEMKRSGLRGRGGAGFPAGRKWESAAKAQSPDGVRYVICNADEGDPGAYMDRAVLEANPHSVIEGMVIGSWAIGSHDGYFYVRTEYPLAVEHVKTALRQAEEHGLLGENILGSGHSFSIKVVRGAGAFVCGESTALMASIEGRVGRPRAKYVHATDKGLHERPTNLNNVETWATVPLIVNRGADWFARIGTGGSKGTKIFSLVGKINNTGLVEVPMGIALRDIIFAIGGGVPKGKSVQGRADGRSLGRLHPREPARPARGLRGARRRPAP